jgi:hypothetical protein
MGHHQLVDLLHALEMSRILELRAHHPSTVYSEYLVVLADSTALSVMRSD